MYSEGKYNTLIYILYFALFNCLLITICPIVKYYCNIVKIPFDLSLSVISLGFGYEMTLVISLLAIASIHFLIKNFCKLLINLTF